MFKNKQWICNLIALIILLTGVCVDNVNADSYFAYPQMVTFTVAGAESVTADAVLTEVQVEAAELLCAHNPVISGRIAAIISGAKRTIKLSMVYLCVTVFILLLSNFYTAEQVTEFTHLNESTAVIRYIQDTDGKK